MGRYKKGQKAKRKDVWAEAGGKEVVVFHLLKADILNRDQGYSSDVWTDVSIALFGKDTQKNRVWLWCTWIQNRKGVRDQLHMSNTSDQTTGIRRLEPGEDSIMSWKEDTEADIVQNKMDSEEDRADLERHASEDSGLNNNGPEETRVDLEESTETKHRTQKHCIWTPCESCQGCFHVKCLNMPLSKDQRQRIILNNPKKRNALSLPMLESLRENILIDLDTEDLRVIIISGEGPVFSSGHDLKELTSTQGPDYHRKVFQTCSEVMTLIQDIPVPVIAMVNGVATAAGCQLVASCDIAIATDKSTFATPGVNVGLFCSTPGVALGRAVPRKVAMEMLFTGRPISAQDALLHGLVSKVVRDEQLEEETLAVAIRVCESSRPVVALGKAVFQRQMSQSRDAAYASACSAMLENLKLPDGQEGIRAFLEKRRPVWSNSPEKIHT